MKIQTFAFEGENSEKTKSKLIEEIKVFISLDVDIFWINYQTETKDRKYVAMAKICYTKKQN